MKKYIFGLICASVFVSSYSYAWGLSWESVSSWGDETLDPVEYNVEVSGNNIRVYEWVTPARPYQKCVFVASENNTQLQCDLLTQEQYNEFAKQMDGQ